MYTTLAAVFLMSSLIINKFAVFKHRCQKNETSVGCQKIVFSLLKNVLWLHDPDVNKLY